MQGITGKIIYSDKSTVRLCETLFKLLEMKHQMQEIGLKTQLMRLKEKLTKLHINFKIKDKL